MKKIKTCRNSDILVLLMAVGIILVLLAYRIFSFLCDAGTFVWWMVPLGLLMAVMAAGGFLTAYQSWKRLQYLRPPGGAVSQNHFFHLKISSSSTTHSALAMQTIR